jgi:hypothetical protein
VVLDLGSKKGQVIVVSVEGVLGESLQESQEGFVYEVIIADLDVMRSDDYEDVRSNRSLQWSLGILFDGCRMSSLAFGGVKLENGDPNKEAPNHNHQGLRTRTELLDE